MRCIECRGNVRGMRMHDVSVNVFGMTQTLDNFSWPLWNILCVSFENALAEAESPVVNKRVTLLALEVIRLVGIYAFRKVGTEVSQTFAALIR